MSNESRQRATTDNLRAQGPGGDGNDDALSKTRAEVDKLFAVASKSFQSMTEGNSQEFLRRSRQTGGQ